MAPSHQHSGFTFVELLVAMFIVVALYATVVGPTRAHLRQQRLAQCAENLRKLHMVLSLYANEHDGAFPAADGARGSEDVFATLVPKYSSERSLFTCPATGHSGGQVDFAFVTGLRKDAGISLLASDGQVNAEPKPRGTKVFAEAEGTRGGNHGSAGGNLLFTDGHVETIGTEAPHELSILPGAKLLNPAR